MSILDFYEEAYGQPEIPVSNALRYNARYLAGRSHEEAFVSTGSPEEMVAAILPDTWNTPGKGVDGSAH